MYFSEAFSIDLTDDDDWFDPLLEMDTQLFVDPFLLYKESEGFWSDSGDRIADHFQKGFELLGSHYSNPESDQYKKTIELMIFPEPHEFGLGFVGTGTSGAGTGGGFALLIVEAMVEAINRGLIDLRHFEELGLLVPKIGRDRISDITCNILKDKFIRYTEEVCVRHQIPTQSFNVPHGDFDNLRRRWISKTANLPANPLTGGFILLTPWRFLRELPTLNTTDWWNSLDPTLLRDLNIDLHTRLKKSEIIRIAKENADLIRPWFMAKESTEANPYNISRDPEGLHNWQKQTRDFGYTRGLDLEEVNESNFHEFITRINQKFRHFVENEGGWRLLWNEDNHTQKSERNIQLLYLGVVKDYCNRYSITILREPDLGHGPVDFVFVGDRGVKVVLEVKKMGNGKFWNGLDSQLTDYMTSAECAMGWYLAVQFSSSKTETERKSQLPAETVRLRESTGFDIRSGSIDARRSVSASNLSPGAPTVIEEIIPDPEFD